MKIDNKSLSFKLGLYFIIFSAAIILILWIIQILLIDKYYENMKISETKSMAMNIIKALETTDYREIIIKHPFNENVFIDITDANGKSLLYIQNDIFKIANALRHSQLLVERENNPTRIRGAIDNFNEIKKKITQEKKDSEVQVKTNQRTSMKSIIYGQKFTHRNNEILYLFLNVPLANLTSTEKILKNQLIYVSITLLILSIIISIIISKVLIKPIKKLTTSAKHLAKGNYKVTFESNSYTEINQLADTLNYATKELSKVEGIRREFIANVSHDLRTPLTMIKAYAELIRDISGNNPTKRTKNLEVIIEESDRLSLLVNDLLDLSKVQSSNIKLNIKRFNISETVKQIIKRYTLLIEKENYTIKTQIENNLYVNADEQKIIQVIYNLVNNAINYTNDDKKIEIKLTKTTTKIKFEVYDNGCGIPPEQLPFIWDRYYKIDKEHKRASIGNGLGLSIVKNILTLHNAKFGVKSDNTGSLFWFELMTSN